MSAATTHPSPCVCEDCHARYRRRKQYRLAYERGERQFVDASRARKHLLWLARQGIGRRTVTTALGLSDLTVIRIRNGQRARIRVETERTILAFLPDQAATIANCASVDATATRLRVQALVRLGYTRAYIGQELGRMIEGRAYKELILGERVQRRRALAIIELCKRIGDTPGPSRKAAVQAKNKGWLPPIAYDEADFYDEHAGQLQAGSEKRSQARLVEEMEYLASCGASIEEIAGRLGRTVDHLQFVSRQRRAELAIEREAQACSSPVERVEVGS